MEPTTTPEATSPIRNRLMRFASSRPYRKWVFIGLILAVALIAWLVAGKGKTEEEEPEAIIVSVRVAKAERGPISSEVSSLGTISPREVAIVSPKINGQINQMALLRNKQVRAGDVVVTLESNDLQAQRAEAAAAVAESDANARIVSGGTIPETAAQDEKALRDARANVRNARAIYERRVALYEKGGISKKDLEASELALTTAESDLRVAETAARVHQTTTNPGNRAAAEARVKQARDRLANIDTQLSYATIRAPFSGIITEQFQYQGEYAAAGSKLFTIADVSEVIVKAPFADNVAGQLKVGDEAAILPEDLPGERLTGRISLISRASDPQSRTVEVWVNLKNEGGRLRAAGAARVIASTKTESDAVVVPAAAVSLETTAANEGTVMVVDEQSIAHETKVTVGVRTADRIQITDGLKGGETVVIEGNYALPDGTRVEVNQGDENGGEPPDKKKEEEK